MVWWQFCPFLLRPDRWGHLVPLDIAQTNRRQSSIHSCWWTCPAKGECKLKGVGWIAKQITLQEEVSLSRGFYCSFVIPPKGWGGWGGGGGGLGVAWINQLRERQATRRIPLRRKPSVRSSFFCVVILLVVIVLRGSAIHVFLVRTLFSCCNRVIPVVISNEWKDSGYSVYEH